MPISLLEPILDALLPILVQEAEKLLGTPPNPNDHNWVVGLVQDIASLFDSKLPGWLKPTEQEIEALVEQGLQKLVGMVTKS